ncbi:UPF0157-domain-containing protein [Myriangium duriaei CBS 260.36]|uniref:UPF0157-domain-containing protein n=1 Tax=Myriangium duriaei CBS 260.36 TaxID=1168546 RepID=A0A9P4IVE5_9PEZI|nr:UPF0157-domain-containing protein [Myriangium duriaei CBS 260.36]
MGDKTVNGVPVEAILKHYTYDPSLVQRIPGRTEKAVQLDIVEPDPKWPDHFQLFRSHILAAFEAPLGGGNDSKVKILAINHVGSTSVPNLPAKAIIDIDLVLSANDLSSELFYVPRLAAAGFEFRLREPAWHEHRFFRAWEPVLCNLHVWGPHCPEVERHLIFRDWLRESRDDMELYAKIKKECAAVSKEKGEVIMEYTARKEWIIKEILVRAFTGFGYLVQEDEKQEDEKKADLQRATPELS